MDQQPLFELVSDAAPGKRCCHCKAGYPWPKILAEIEKCVVRCANCHARRTMSNLRSWRTHGIREDAVGFDFGS